MSRKVNKIQEFMSNQGNVNCAKFGKFGQLIATGGQDRKVNIWKVGCPTIVAQLHGHTSTIESVTFDSEEELVVSGSSGGTIKVWDLNSERMQKSFNYGHKTNVTCLDYHPFGNFFCSGSADTQVKVWDLRKKSYLQTYKGHTKQVNTLRFSPDGRWVVSGGGDGIVKLWDLTAGKQMEDFTRHSGEITCLDFHPSEFLLAVGSADRTITFWDLDKFKQISQTPPEPRPIRSIRFTPDGSTLCGSTSESLKVWNWEPVTCHDAVDVQWQNVGDLHVGERSGELLGISYVDSFVSVWNVRLRQMHPFSEGPGGEPQATVKAPLAPRGAPPSFADRQSPATVKAPGSMRAPSFADRDGPATVKAIPPPRAVPPPAQPPVAARKPEHREYSVSAETKAARIQEVFQNMDDIQKKFGMADTAEFQRQLDQKKALRKNNEAQHANVRSGYHQGNGVYGASPARMPEPMGLDVDRLPKSSGLSETAIAEKLLGGHHALCQTLLHRLTNVKVLRSLWAQDRRGAIQHAQQLRDPSVSVDFVRQAVRKERDLSLDLCVALLPVIRQIYASSLEPHLVVALEATSTIWHAFGDLIAKTLSTKSHVVDVSLEERKDKCRIARSLFAEIRVEVELLKDRSDDVGQRSRLLWKELPIDTVD